MYLEPATLGANGPVIKLQLLRQNVDPRDALDFPRAETLSPSDLMITRDTATIELAWSRPEFRVVPLVWDVTYVMFGWGPTSPTPQGFRETLMAAGIPGDVRDPEPRDPTQSTCNTGTQPAKGPSRIAYASDDPIARALAERLVAMSVSNSWLMSQIPGANAQVRVRTLPMTAAALDTAMMAGMPYAFIVQVPHAEPHSCWARLGGPVLGPVVPLADSRPHAIIRRGVPSLDIDGEGLVRLHPRSSNKP
jgi:hypothetical protein